MCPPEKRLFEKYASPVFFISEYSFVGVAFNYLLYSYDVVNMRYIQYIV